MRERVRGYADAVLETSPADAATLGAEIDSFSQLLDSNTDLQWALNSPATSVPTRRAILQELLAGKVSAPVLGLLSFVLQNGGADDFTEDVTGLAVAAHAKRDGMVLLDEGPLGRLSATDRLEGYAASVLAPVHGERRLGDLEDELFRFMRIVEGNDDLRVALTTSELSSEVRSSIVRDLLAQHARPESVRLATYATRIGRPRDFPLLLDALVEMVAKETNRRVADVRSAIELTAAQHKSLAAALSKFTGHAVDVRVTPEPQLLGGFVATVGDLVIDTSLRRRLEQASELLMQPPAQTGAGSTGAGSTGGGSASEPGTAATAGEAGNPPPGPGGAQQ